jgi:hypothetical protein
MATLEHLTFSELEKLIRTLKLPSDTRLTVTFDDEKITQKAMKRQKALDAMSRLKGSGNGKLVATLLSERERDTLL